MKKSIFKRLLTLALSVLLLVTLSVPAFAAEAEEAAADTDCTLYVENFDEDTNAPLAGATFELWQKSVLGTSWHGGADRLVASAVTDENGKIAFHVADGHYYLKETAPAFGYNDANRLLQWSGAKLRHGQEATIRVPNDRYTGSVVLTQKGEVRLADGTLSSTPVKGAEYQLYCDAACTMACGTDSFVTDANGEIALDGLYAGTYYAKQISLPRIYESSPDVIEVGTIDAAGKTVSAAADAKLKTGFITVKNQNVSDNEPLAGAAFQLWQKSVGNTSWAGGHDICVAEGVTDENGTVTFEVPIGTYFVRQAEAPFGFYPLGNELMFATAKIRTAGEQETISLNSTRYYGSLTLNAVTEKRAADGSLVKKALGYTAYNIYTDAACTQLYTTVKTDSTGAFTVTGVPAGSYYARAARASYGYQAPAVVAFDMIDAPDKAVSAADTKALSVGTLHINYVPGATFEVWQKYDGSSARWDRCRRNVCVGTVTTDENGHASVDLTTGTYYLKEAKVLAGYESIASYLHPYFTSVKLTRHGEVQSLTLPAFAAKN